MTDRVRLVGEYFHPWPNSAGFYLARERGWYAEVGIELELVTFDAWVGDGLEYLNSGRADFGVFPSNRLLQRRELGQQLVGVAAVNQRGLETVLTVAGSGIERLADLSGRRLGLNPTPRGRAIVRELVARDGGDPDRVQLVDLGSRELTAAEIANGVVDATFGSYWAWDNLREDYPSHQLRAWEVDRHLGVGYHSYLLGTREDVLADNPELVRRFVEATARGYEAAAADPSVIPDLYERITPYFSRRLLARSGELISSTWLHEGRWGTLRTELIEPYSAWLADHQVIGDPEIWRAAIRPAVPVG
ncbi:NitT/TauT family transport system substrate-binding protein [Propionicimonas paludicola]|uniref:Thiamine pyrimidine synthase n=1 Tax=Propionicimonas paludicola TaxID=185243 RepID=A0A2A9CSY8_9ACTN|nr:ABC transporter substrate-binding protein [Propionicimonas paludicola]PFG17165.1 NitT/TauT family transport system substrate-binding protein [Propionicimonas paludicola]